MSHVPHIQDLIAIRRRTLLAGLAGLPLLSLNEAKAQPAPGSAPSFTSVPATNADACTVPPGYTARPLIAWGDALFDSVSATVDLDALTRQEQEQRFGTSSDMLALFPAAHAFPPPRAGADLLMCVNHEYFDPPLMFPGARALSDFDADKLAAMWAAMGVSVVRLEQASDAWRVLRDPRPGTGHNRRITPFTPVTFEGPAKTHRWIEAASAKWREIAPADNGGVACGTLANCAGGQTPWGTYLTAEENFDSYFRRSGDSPELTAAAEDPAWLWASGNLGSPLFTGSTRVTSAETYNVTANPYGPALYGWVVEIDPYDPNSSPKKRTALGRFKHEAATTALARDGRVVVYSGDDQINEHVYKFVSAGRFNPTDRAANMNLLDEGQLYVAKFEANGRGRWLAMTPEAVNAARADYTAPFTDMGDVVIRAREAARALGATPMDRPEDVEAILDDNWVGQGQVLVVCTNNRNEQPKDPGNPLRPAPGGARNQANLAGHVLKIEEDAGDCGSTRFRWDVFALGGDPDASSLTHETPAGEQALVSVNQRGRAINDGDRFACPDNVCFDAAKNAWISTDGSPAVFADCNDSVLVAPTLGRGPRNVKRFLVGPVGAEICGPTIAPDQRAFLCCVQHPGDSDVEGRAFADTRWSDANARPPSSFPDGNGAWPRSAVVVVTKDDGGIVGT